MIRTQYPKMEGDPALFDALFWRPHTGRTLKDAFQRL